MGFYLYKYYIICLKKFKGGSNMSKEEQINLLLYWISKSAKKDVTLEDLIDFIGRAESVNFIINSFKTGGFYEPIYNQRREIKKETQKTTFHIN